jgi:hypothetical protein
LVGDSSSGQIQIEEGGVRPTIPHQSIVNQAVELLARAIGGEENILLQNTDDYFSDVLELRRE